MNFPTAWADALRLAWQRVRAEATPIAQRALVHLRHPTRRGIALALAAGPLALLLYAIVLIPFTPSIRDIRNATTEHPAQILSADGKKIAELRLANRQWVRLADISPHVVDALIATEDHRFYEHHGLDLFRTGAALVHTLGGDRQGGSTLTQQLARNLYPDDIGRAPTLTRKLKEAITALKIEAVHDKDDILETYLNTVPFLYNAHGIEMAARTYFDTSAKRLDLLQSATLVGMLKGNSYYNPVLNPERSLQRRNTVLAQMVRREKLKPARYEILKKAPLNLDFERQFEKTGAAPHMTQILRKWLIAWADRNDYNLYNDGLVIRTTLDSRLQALANQAVARQGLTLQAIADGAWPRSAWQAKHPTVQAFIRETADYRAARAAGATHEQAIRKLTANPAFLLNLRQQKTMIESGFLALDPNTGAVRAWVGGRDFEKDAFDHVQQARRQPGSTFKPFVYGEAFRQGIRPDSTLVDRAVEIPVGRNEIWRPRDGKPPSDQPMTLRDGLAQSKNTITAQVMQQVGPAKVVRLARALGVRQSPLEAVPSLALGTSPVSLKEMVAAYAAIAGGGRYRAPYLITRIEDRNGRVLEEFAAAAPERALDETTDYALLDALRGVIDRGTGIAIRNRFGIRADVAGKTGTTQDNADGWFILMHPQLVAGAWVGFNDPRITLRSDYWGQGAHSALPIVGEVFSGALRTRLIDERQRFTAPDDRSLWQRLVIQVSQWAEKLMPSWFAPPPPPPRKAAPPKPENSEPAEDADPLQEVIDRIIAEDTQETPAKTAPPATPPTTPETTGAQD
ncbi:transglycosylase domain-containing protein [uncultured Propionivibrio sp.]|uniref:penicillin-binding protein 1A n=1 Tax=uncultured Propionivibrio sp. TaxID=426737 RepID=UPI0029BFEE98|nr:transglycosylase domain-containing protein [uncultured Propionivibrio sp.]